MKNIEKYKNIIIDNTDVCSINRLLLKKNIKGFCSGHSCEGCKERAIKWLLEECKEPVLDEVERKYLSDVIKPFRKSVLYISKIEKGYNPDICFISIVLNGSEKINLPYFDIKKSDMYAGMKPFVIYSLEELGL